MKSLRAWLCLPLFAVLLTATYAWNDTGHMVIAAIAYQRLTPQAKAEADRLLKTGGTPQTRDFYSAACWADDYRRDHRETGPWHYIDLHFRTDHKPTPNQPDAENVVWAIAKFKAVLADKSKPDAERADALRFLLHFVGDIHQPLHSVARDTDQFPQGDAGGNKFPIQPPAGVGGDRPPHNLHALWDLGCGLFPWEGPRPLDAGGHGQIDLIRDKVTGDDPFKKSIVQDMDPMDWAKSGVKISQEFVYSLPENTAPTPEYLKEGQEISARRAAEAGYRLAALLNSVLN